MISAPEPEDGAEASIEKSSGNQVPTPSPSLGVVETGEYTLGDEKSNHGNKIIASTDVILDNFVKDVLAEHPQAESEEPGEANELVEDTAGTTGIMEYKNIKGKYNILQLTPWAHMCSSGFYQILS